MTLLRNLAVMATLVSILLTTPLSAENLESDGFIPSTETSTTQSATVSESASAAGIISSRPEMEQPISQEELSSAGSLFQELKKSFGALFRALSELCRSLTRIFASLFGSLTPPSAPVPTSAPESAPPTEPAPADTPSQPAASDIAEKPSSEEPSSPQQPQSGTPGPVPYYSQWDNTIDDFGTCQNTSIAMTLNSLGWQGKPDDITSEFGRKLGQTPEGVAEIINTLASRAGLNFRAQSHRASLSEFKSAVAKGLPVITHGWFTKSGHVVCVKGYENGTYIVNDPAGQWNGQMYGSINGWVSGEDARYDAASFEQAIEDDVWYTEIIPA